MTMMEKTTGHRPSRQVVCKHVSDDARRMTNASDLRCARRTTSRGCTRVGSSTPRGLRGSIPGGVEMREKGEGEERSPRSSGVRSRLSSTASHRCLLPRQVMSTPLGGRGDDDYDDDTRWEEQDIPYLSQFWRRAEGGEGDVDDGVDDKHVNGRVGVRVWRIPGMGDGGDCSATATTMTTSRRADHIPPPRRRRRRAKRAMSTTTATTNTSTGVFGVRVGRIPGMGDGGDRGATVTTMTTSRRADRIPPR